MAAYIRPENPSASWRHPDDLASARFEHADGKIFLGNSKDRSIWIDDNRHLMTIAGSRAGKTATSLIPNLTSWTGSVIAIDPKGELATKTATKRAGMGQDVCILDPFNVVKGDAASHRIPFNLLDILRASDPDDVIDDAATLAEAIITDESRSGGKADHWIMSAKNLIRGLILYAMRQDPAGASLKDVRRYLTLPYQEDDEDAPAASETLESVFLDMLDDDDAFGGVLAGVGGTMLGKPDTERGSIISTAIEQTAFLDSKKMRGHLSDTGSLTTLAALKEKPTTIYLVLPASRLATHFRWLRSVLTLAMTALEKTENQLDTPVLFILEEFPSLGHVRQLEAAAGLMAGYGVKLWTVIQDLSQLKAHYPQSWETFIGNAGVLEAFGNTDSTTLEYLSKQLGTTLAYQVPPSDRPSLSAQQGGDTQLREGIVTVPLMAPWEIALGFSRDKSNKLIIIAGEKPFALRRSFGE